ncbi:MAG: hypothetical protein RM021_024470 [Nostoc sp. EkiNYC01]|nr:hypothetical protein [Nostoc sp. EkiNYC01]
MVNPFTQKPEPYPFKGGEASEYEVFIGQAGTWCTRHRVSGETIQSVQPANDMFNIANLGINILNLGLGIYNAAQLHQVKNKLDRNHEQIQSCFNSIQNALTVQHRTLELLVSNQCNLARQMNILREEMRTGFQNVVQEVKDLEARRCREEFETRTFKLLKAYERFTYLLPESLEADQLIERAEDLEAWLISQLNRIDAGKPERLPLLVALSFSIRAKADAFEAKGGNYTDFATKDISLLIKQISNEAGAFSEGRSLYSLGIEMPEILYQYALLNRSLRKGRNLQRQVDSEVIFSAEQAIWDDGMEELRELFNPTNIKNIEYISVNESIGLHTMADYDWYISFANEDKATFNIHSCAFIKLSDILRKIGYPDPLPQTNFFRKSSINTLKVFALPKKMKNISHLIKHEFELESFPKLRGLNNLDIQK